MSKTKQSVVADDGLSANEVGTWAQAKHNVLREYVRLSSGARKGWLGPTKAGATFIDLFCAYGRSRTEEGKWIDGSSVVAWKTAVENGSPFSAVYIADIDPACREIAAKRLRVLGAPVRELAGDAVKAATDSVRHLDPFGLHLAFLDPYNLGALDFEIIRTLARFKRMDIIIHVSAMDLQRNVASQLQDTEEDFDRFAPGWRESIDTHCSNFELRVRLVEYWKSLVEDLASGRRRAPN